MNVKKDFIDGALKDNTIKASVKPPIKPPIKASENKRKYLEKHALYIKIPTYSVESSRIYKKDPEYFIQLCKYSIPGDEDDKESEDKQKFVVVASYIDDYNEGDNNKFTPICTYKDQMIK